MFKIKRLILLPWKTHT